ncbi:MAG TPA: alpha/beta fold hydrolase, partial [Steroidobacteraceae bacterium]|nr:alpha/beta fold hydrolase [Steroidobacteraceae bacterium]
ATATATAATALAAAPDSAAAQLQVGNLTLSRCATTAPWCARLERALDPTGAVPGSVAVYFEYWPHTGPGAAAGTLVATEGGPGYPATENRGEYLALFAPLRERFDVVIMDNRGTGRSGAVDCRALQEAPALTEAAIGACGRSLGRRAPLYSTALAADDLAAVLDALGIGRINLYGDSYGTYFAQVFALRHPDRLRSLVLDGAYPLEGPDYPWYPHYAPAMRDKFNLTCARAPACSAVGGSSQQHIAPALAALRARPFQAEARRGDGTPTHFRADAGQLATVMFGSAPANATVRETDAAARAFQAGDRAPLLRLMAEALSATDSRDPTHAAAAFSAGLAAAVFCQDAPQIFDMALDPIRRAPQRDAVIAQRRLRAPDTYAPFTIDEYRRMPIDYAFIDECVAWPAVAADSPARPLVPARPYPPVPVLVVSGELDNMTSVADGAAAAAHFPRAHHVVIANGFHVNALPHARSACAAILVRRFMAGLDSGDESCAAAVPPVRLVPQFARHASELTPAQALAGNEAPAQALRAVTAALLTVEDAIVRAAENGAGKGAGLRGGSFTATSVGGGYHLVLHALRWTEELSVSGEVDWPGRTGEVHVLLGLDAPQRRGKLEARWSEGIAHARATIRGSLGGRNVAAEGPAP